MTQSLDIYKAVQTTCFSSSICAAVAYLKANPEEQYLAFYKILDQCFVECARNNINNKK